MHVLLSTTPATEISSDGVLRFEISVSKENATVTSFAESSLARSLSVEFQNGFRPGWHIMTPV